MKNKANDPWLKVLEDRVSELQQKHEHHKKNVSDVIAAFRIWARDANDVDIYYDAEFKADRIAKAREAYKSVWSELKKAEAELEAYKEITGCDEK